VIKERLIEYSTQQTHTAAHNREVSLALHVVVVLTTAQCPVHCCIVRHNNIPIEAHYHRVCIKEGWQGPGGSTATDLMSEKYIAIRLKLPHYIRFSQD
jgi:hypothetical protein